MRCNGRRSISLDRAPNTRVQSNPAHTHKQKTHQMTALQTAGRRSRVWFSLYLNAFLDLFGVGFEELHELRRHFEHELLVLERFARFHDTHNTRLNRVAPILPPHHHHTTSYHNLCFSSFLLPPRFLDCCCAQMANNTQHNTNTQCHRQQTN
jgi:hypothetical protein